MNNTVSYKDLYETVNDFRKENNERFDRIERIFEKHTIWSEGLVVRYTTDYEKRISSLEKIADKAMLIVLIVSGVIAAAWQLGLGWIKKQFNI